MANELTTLPRQSDTDNQLLKKIIFAVLGNSVTTGTGALGGQDDAPAGVPATLTPTSIIALLKAILNKNVTIDASNSQIVLELDEVENGIGLKNGATSPKEIDPDAVSSLIGYLRGVLEAANTIAVASAGVSAIGTFTGSSASPGGAAYSVFGSAAASTFRFTNNTGEILEFRTVAQAGPPEEVGVDASVSYPCVANMNEWEWRKKAATAPVLTINGAFQDS